MAQPVELALVAVLLQTPAVAGYVHDRVYPANAPRGAAKPFIVYSTISSSAEHSHDAAETTWRTRVQVACVDRSYGGAKTVAKAVIQALRYYVGQIAGSQIDVILAENEVDTFVMSADQNQSSYITTVDFVVWHR